MIGVYLLYEGFKLVIDSGMVIIFDVVGLDGGFEGGIILFGINLFMCVLYDVVV